MLKVDGSSATQIESITLVSDSNEVLGEATITSKGYATFSDLDYSVAKKSKTPLYVRVNMHDALTEDGEFSLTIRSIVGTDGVDTFAGTIKPKALYSNSVAVFDSILVVEKSSANTTTLENGTNDVLIFTATAYGGDVMMDGLAISYSYSATSSFSYFTKIHKLTNLDTGGTYMFNGGGSGPGGGAVSYTVNQLISEGETVTLSFKVDAEGTTEGNFVTAKLYTLTTNGVNPNFLVAPDVIGLPVSNTMTF